MKRCHSFKHIIKGVRLHALFLLLHMGLTPVIQAQVEDQVNDAEAPYVNPELDDTPTEPKKFRLGFDIGMYGGSFVGQAAPTEEASSIFSDASTEITAGVQSQLVALIPIHPKVTLRPFTGIQIMDSRIEYSRFGFNSKQRVPVLQSAATLGVKIMFGNFNFMKGPIVSVGGSVMFNANPGQTERITTPATIPCFDVSAGWPVQLGNSQTIIEAFYGVSLVSMIESQTLHEQWWDDVTLHKFGLRLAIF